MSKHPTTSDNHCQFAARTWHVLVRGKTAKLSERELIEQYRSGRVVSSSKVWCEGMPEWRPLESVPELFEVLEPGDEPSLLEQLMDEAPEEDDTTIVEAFRPDGEPFFSEGDEHRRDTNPTGPPRASNELPSILGADTDEDEQTAIFNPSLHDLRRAGLGQRDEQPSAEDDEPTALFDPAAHGVRTGAARSASAAGLQGDEEPPTVRPPPATYPPAHAAPATAERPGSDGGTANAPRRSSGGPPPLRRPQRSSNLPARSGEPTSPRDIADMAKRIAMASSPSKRAEPSTDGASKGPVSLPPHAPPPGRTTEVSEEETPAVSIRPDALVAAEPERSQRQSQTSPSLKALASYQRPSWRESAADGSSGAPETVTAVRRRLSDLQQRYKLAILVVALGAAGTAAVATALLITRPPPGGASSAVRAPAPVLSLQGRGAAGADLPPQGPHASDARGATSEDVALPGVVVGEAGAGDSATGAGDRAGPAELDQGSVGAHPSASTEGSDGDRAASDAMQPRTSGEQGAAGRVYVDAAAKGERRPVKDHLDESPRGAQDAASKPASRGKAPSASDGRWNATDPGF